MTLSANQAGCSLARRPFLCRALLAVLFLAPLAAQAQLQLVNMIPQNKSDETYQNSETNLTLDPTHPSTIVGSAFTAMRSGASNASVFVSLNGGADWNQNEILPSVAGFWINTYDTSLKFGGSSQYLYVGYLYPGGFNLRIDNTNDPNVNTTVSTLFPGRTGPDQPFVAANTVMGWFDPGKDRVYVGTDDFSHHPKSSTIDYFLDALGAPSDLIARVEATTPGGGRDGHQTRPAIHLDGTVYVAFTRWNGASGSDESGDIVIVRDDNWGKGATPFTSLMSGGTAGVQVAAGITVPFGNTGQQRGGGGLSIAVDPRNSQTVYVAYVDKQGTDSATVHLKQSLTGGSSGSWPATDLLGPIHNAINPAVAVNSHGRIGLLYQQLVTCSAANCWETHFRRSDDGTTWSDLLLATFTDGNPAWSFDPYVGDYENLIAYGKDFYGIFSSDNTPDTSHFATGVVFQRNANWSTHQLLGTDNMTVVPNSIDPFFFHTTELDPASDFYVRDWTNSSSDHDFGAEPSTHADFFSTSDVWNRRSNDPFPMTAADQPQNQRAQPVALGLGPNYAFARVSRNAHGSAQSVNLHFLYSDGGVGVNYEAAGSTTLNFGATDDALRLEAGQGVAWNLPSGASNHVCLAVEIDTPSDPLIQPSLLHHAPGWPNTDLWVITDNNKAQRNMEVYDGLGGSNAPGFMVVHNAAWFARDMTIGIEWPKGVPANPVRVVGGSGRPGDVEGARQTVVLPGMAAGENRWLAFDLNFPEAKPGTIAGPVRVFEIAKGNRVNGYGIGVRANTLEQVERENLLQQVAVFDRFASLGMEECRKVAEIARRLVEEKKAGELENYRSALDGVTQCAEKLMASTPDQDAFAVKEGLAALSSAKDKPSLATAHLGLLNRLDALVTMLQKAKGDPADIVQMVELERRLLAQHRTLRQAAGLEREVAGFVAQMERRADVSKAFVALMQAQLPALEEIAQNYPNRPQLAQAAKAIASSMGDIRGLQRAHREYLLNLESVLQ